jgi:hypothetical protein
MSPTGLAMRKPFCRHSMRFRTSPLRLVQASISTFRVALVRLWSQAASMPVT